MVQQIIEFKGRIPSKKNSKMFVQRGARRFLVPSEAYQQWLKDQEWVHAKLRGKTIQNILGVDVRFQMPDNRRADMDNKLQSLLDFMVGMQIIKDDSWQELKAIQMLVEKIAKEPITKVHIYYKEENLISKYQKEGE